MCEQAKSLSRETYQVSITLMVASRDSYRDFHKEGYHGDCDCNGQELDMTQSFHFLFLVVPKIMVVLLLVCKSGNITLAKKQLTKVDDYLND